MREPFPGQVLNNFLYMQRATKNHWPMLFNALKLTTLDEDKKPLKNSTGFILLTDNGPYLHTCWHVVTGIDFYEPKVPLGQPIPRYLKIRGADIWLGSEKESLFQIGGINVGSHHEVIIPLYDDNSFPVWEQRAGGHREHSTLNPCNIYVPHQLDAVRLSVDLSPEITALWSIDKSRLGNGYGDTVLFSELIVSGYPFGYSSREDLPAPIFLKRSVASYASSINFDTYLDAGCSKSMSGGPIWTKSFKFVGIYRVLIYPDA